MMKMKNLAYNILIDQVPMDKVCMKGTQYMRYAEISNLEDKTEKLLRG